MRRVRLSLLAQTLARVDAALLYLDFYAGGNFYGYDIVGGVNLFYNAVDTAGGDDVVAYLKGVAELFNFLLLLLLGKNHEEIHNRLNDDNHSPER